MGSSWATSHDETMEYYGVSRHVFLETMAS